MTNLEAKQALARKLNIDYSDIANNDLFSETDLQDFVNQGAMQAYDFRFWDFAEHSKTAVLLAGDITNGYVAYPSDILPSSIYLLTVGGKEFDKKNFTSYKKYFIDDSAGTDKLWAEFKRMIFLNTNNEYVVAGATLDVYGKRGYRNMSADGDLLPFSPTSDNEEMSGNQACVLLAYAEALASEKKKNPTQSEIERKKAYEILGVIAKQLEAGRASEQIKNRPMFNVPNYFGRNTNGSTDTGRFSI